MTGPEIQKIHGRGARPQEPGPEAIHKRRRPDIQHLLVPLLLCSASVHASLCERGQRQSPINITQAAIVSHQLPAMLAQYRDAPLVVANDGRTLRVRFANSGQLILGKERYTLQQFHFHTPGGEQIQGESFPFAAHILHKSGSGQLLAIVVPFRLGSGNPLLAQLLPLIPARPDGEHRWPALTLNASQLLPKSLGYYRYTGSLTAAPCTEGVQWLVMKQPQELSSGQLAAWRQHFADNMREVNPLHQRPIFETPSPAAGPDRFGFDPNPGEFSCLPTTRGPDCWR